VHLIGFIIRIYNDARSSECQIHLKLFVISAYLLLHIQYFEKSQTAIQEILSWEVQQIRVEIFQFLLDS